MLPITLFSHGQSLDFPFIKEKYKKSQTSSLKGAAVTHLLEKERGEHKSNFRIGKGSWVSEIVDLTCIQP